MIVLANVLAAWGEDSFKKILKHELEQLDAGVLPLQQGLSHSSYTDGHDFTVMILSVLDQSASINIKAGVFYSGLIPGCNCADDPSPIDEYAEYCELQFTIDKGTAEATVKLISE